MNAFQEANVPYEVEEILGPVKLVMQELTLPSVNVNVEKYVNEIEEAFPNNVVKDNDVEKLRLYLEKTLNQILKDMEEKLNDLTEQISSSLNQKAVLLWTKFRIRFKKVEIGWFGNWKKKRRI